MSILNYFAQKALEHQFKRNWGFKPKLAKAILQDLSATSVYQWHKNFKHTFQSALDHFGPVRTHGIITLIALLHRSPYVVFGHAYALNLYYYKRVNLLLPISENEILEWSELPKKQILSHFEQLIHELEDGADLNFWKEILEHIQIPFDIQRPIIRPLTNLSLLEDLKELFFFINQIGLKNALKPDQAHSSINKNNSLRIQYHKSRLKDLNKSQINEAAKIDQ